MPATISGSQSGSVGLINTLSAQNSTSGTSIDFTGIPSGVRRVTVILYNLSTTGTAFPQIQIGSGSVSTSGYGGSWSYNGTTQGGSTTGLQIGFNSASDTRQIVCTWVTPGSNIWVGTAITGLSTAGAMSYSATSIALGGALDRVRITTVGGTDSFDSGVVNVLYE